MRDLRDWIKPEVELPPEGVEVDAMDSGAHVQSLIYESGLWWQPGKSVYVYFTPTCWRLPL